MYVNKTASKGELDDSCDEVALDSCFEMVPDINDEKMIVRFNEEELSNVCA